MCCKAKTIYDNSRFVLISKQSFFSILLLYTTIQLFYFLFQSLRKSKVDCWNYITRNVNRRVLHNARIYLMEQNPWRIHRKSNGWNITDNHLYGWALYHSYIHMDLWIGSIYIMIQISESICFRTLTACLNPNYIGKCYFFIYLYSFGIFVKIIILILKAHTHINTIYITIITL